MKTPTDTEILDWLDRNLRHLNRLPGVDMDGTRFLGQLDNEARGSGGGPSYVSIRSRDLRTGVIEAMNWKK